MACLDMYNTNNKSEHKTSHHHHHHHHHHQFGPVSPRISFSNDFADSQQAIKQDHRSSAAAAVSSDFEFSVSSNYSVMSGADELFFKGRLLPFKETTSFQRSTATTTLKDELLHGDQEDDYNVTHRPPKSGSTGWKSLLGLKRTHIGSHSKNSKADHKSSVAASGEGRSSGLMLHEVEEAHFTKTSSQDLLNINEGGSSCGDVEIGI